MPRPSIRYRDIVQIIRIDPFQATDVKAEFFRIGAAPVVRVDTAVSTKEVFRHPLPELILHQCGFALDYLHILFWDGSDNRAFAFAERTITAMGIRNAVGQVDFQNDRAAMTAGAMMNLDLGAADLPEHLLSPPG
jgi:hypothetical protein